MVAKRRVVTLMRLVRSSARPKAKAGIPASSQGQIWLRKSCGKTTTAANKPSTMGKPPTRGVG